MEYRTTYNDQRVIVSVPNDANSITHSNDKFIIDTITDTILKLASLGVDVSYFWQEDLAGRFEPYDTEVPISNHPINDSYERKAFVQSLSVDYSRKQFVFNVVVRHFKDGNYDNTVHDDVFVSTLIDNNTLENDTPAFDFFYGVIKSGQYSLPQLQDLRIGVMDQNGRFQNIYQ